MNGYWKVGNSLNCSYFLRTVAFPTSTNISKFSNLIFTDSIVSLQNFRIFAKFLINRIDFMNKKLILLVLALFLSLSFAPNSSVAQAVNSPAVSNKAEKSNVTAKVANTGNKQTITPSHRSPGSPGMVHPKLNAGNNAATAKPHLQSHQNLFNHKNGTSAKTITPHLHTHKNLFNYKNKVKTPATKN